MTIETTTREEVKNIEELVSDIVEYINQEGIFDSDIEDVICEAIEFFEIDGTEDEIENLILLIKEKFRQSNKEYFNGELSLLKDRQSILEAISEMSFYYLSPEEILDTILKNGNK